MVEKNVTEVISAFKDNDALSDPSSTAYPYHFPPQTHTIVAAYLLIIGVLGTLGNSVALATFIRHRSLVNPTNLLLINLAISDIGLIALGFPFSASSSFSGKWIFGPGGCQLYAFTGFLFGSAHIGTLTALALDRYLIICRVGIRSKLSYRRYGHLLTAVWAYAFFWAVMPLIGWGRYGPEPSITTCTIDWQHNDTSYKSFIMVYFVLGYVVPLIIICACYCAVGHHMQSQKGSQNKCLRDKNSVHDQWANEKSITKMTVTLITTFIIAWTPYAVVCLWPVFHDPMSLPPFLTLLPPLVAKATTIVDPFIYFFSNPKLRSAIVDTLLCSCQSALHETIEIGETSERRVPVEE